MNVSGQDTTALGQVLNKVTGQTIDITSTASAQSSVTNRVTKAVVLCATVDCWFELGANPTATLGSGTSTFLPAGALSYPMRVTGGTTKIAAIADSETGKVSILEAG